MTYVLDVVLNRDQEIVSAFGGDLLPMHAAATATAGRLAMRPVPRPFDVVVTTNSGFRLDQNLYQAVKGHVGGVPGDLPRRHHRVRRRVPRRLPRPRLVPGRPRLRALPATLLETIEARSAGETVPDQWQLRIQARIEARVPAFRRFRSQVAALGTSPGTSVRRTVERSPAGGPARVGRRVADQAQQYQRA
ncbi:hypothetical protein ABGB09_12155 [Streptomyces sp. B8F3]|uniref:hypothetical protein n=1 Tax=Streptomyces sp. B8F3 TaxID=3153573 RepID=UPI00325E60B0